MGSGLGIGFSLILSKISINFMLFQNKKISFPKIKIMSRDKCKIDLLSAPLIILCPKWCKNGKKNKSIIQNI